MASKNRVAPPFKPRNSLVIRGVKTDRSEITPENRLLRCPVLTLLPSTVPVPGKAATTSFRKSGMESYLLTAAAARVCASTATSALAS